jgi:macrodomain Ter protein organizer (MatP/YcbG family)
MTALLAAFRKFENTRKKVAQLRFEVWQDASTKQHNSTATLAFSLIWQLEDKL